MATKKNSKKSVTKTAKKGAKKAVKKTAKKAVKKSSKKSSASARRSSPSISRDFEDMQDPVVYQPTMPSGDSLPLSASEKKSAFPQMALLAVLLIVVALVTYKSFSSDSDDKGVMHTETKPVVEAPAAEKPPEVPAVTATEPAAPKEQPAAETPAPQPAGERTYTVKHGDTFWGIAAKELGNGNKAAAIQKLNPGVNLKTGMTIKLPAK